MLPRRSESLKPSLVEWKRLLLSYLGWRSTNLETFLGGMETGKVWGRVEGLWALETFLGGMETAQ